jgi:hypothetical protein
LKPNLPVPKLTITKPDNGYDLKPYLNQLTIPKQNIANLNYGYAPNLDVPKLELTIPNSTTVNSLIFKGPKNPS